MMRMETYPQCCSAPLLAQRAVRSDRNVDGGADAIGHALLASHNAYKT
jgi:hypothetical protein